MISTRKRFGAVGLQFNGGCTKPAGQRKRPRGIAGSFLTMYAVFQNGSHQYLVREGDRVTIDRHDGELGAEIVFDKVLLMAGSGEPSIGSPLLEGAKVVGQVVRQFKDKKIIIQKFRRRKNMRRRNGHRQPYTTVRITSVAIA
jgi:large subunit ribosomal protein L21